MTVICATSLGDGQAAIACDSAGTDGWGMQSDHGAKLQRYPFGVVGFAGSYATLPLLRDELAKIEKLESQRDQILLANAALKSLRDAGWQPDSCGHPENTDLSLLILTPQDRIFTLQSDFAVLETERANAIGSGYQVATSAALVALDMGDTPRQAAVRAVSMAIRLISSCGGKVHVEEARQG